MSRNRSVGSHRSCPAPGLVGAVVALATLFGVVPSAWAGVALGVVPNVPSSLTVGQELVPASLTIINQSSGAEAALTVTLTQITLVPNCGVQLSAADCPAGAVDPNVLRLSGTGVGEAGTACAGTVFTTSPVDAVQDKYAFSPSMPVVFGAAGTPSASCVIDFTVDVVRTPRNDASAAGAGLQTEQLAGAGGLASDGVNGAGAGFNEVTINKAAIGPLATQVSAATITLGGSFTDAAALTPAPDAAPPTGTVTFRVFSDAACTTQVATSTSTPNAAGTTAISGGFTPAAAGTYHVIASYSGDANYNPSARACGEANENVVVS
ncbi:MAG: hypothetical protein QOG86_255, partial [Thermoleophilaceae bacterium]|nr:hypothetical protein [Thermoleophilaceae bacterium]